MEFLKRTDPNEPLRDAKLEQPGEAEAKTECCGDIDPKDGIEMLLHSLRQTIDLTMGMIRYVLEQETGMDLSGLFNESDIPEENMVVIWAEPGVEFEFTTMADADARILRKKNIALTETELSMDGSLCIRYDIEDVVALGEHFYLTGPLIITEIDGYGNQCSITKTTYANYLRFQAENLTRIEVGGRNYYAFRLD